VQFLTSFTPIPWKVISNSGADLRGDMGSKSKNVKERLKLGWDFWRVGQAKGEVEKEENLLPSSRFSISSFSLCIMQP